MEVAVGNALEYLQLCQGCHQRLQPDAFKVDFHGFVAVFQPAGFHHPAPVCFVPHLHARFVLGILRQVLALSLIHI